MGHTWGRQDLDGLHVGPMNLAISVLSWGFATNSDTDTNAMYLFFNPTHGWVCDCQNLTAITVVVMAFRSPVTRLFVQPHVSANTKNIKVPHYWSFVRETHCLHVVFFQKRPVIIGNFIPCLTGLVVLIHAGLTVSLCYWKRPLWFTTLNLLLFSTPGINEMLLTRYKSRSCWTSPQLGKYEHAPKIDFAKSNMPLMERLTDIDSIAFTAGS